MAALTSLPTCLRSSKVSYLKWASGADRVMVTGDSRWGLGDSGQGFKLDTAGVSAFPGQSLSLKTEKTLISKVKFKRACEVLVSEIPHMPQASPLLGVLRGLGGGGKRGWTPGCLVGTAVTGSCWGPQPLEGGLRQLCCPGPLTVQSECPHPAHLSDLLEAVWLHVGEDVALGLGEDLEGHGAMVVLQGRDVIIADGQLRAGVDLVPGWGRGRQPQVPALRDTNAEVYGSLLGPEDKL